MKKLQNQYVLFLYKKLIHGSKSTLIFSYMKEAGGVIPKLELLNGGFNVLFGPPSSISFCLRCNCDG